ncbi:MAG: hypothetical protein MJB14_00810, partial [Spirochaetes bacterium]|nr:hypothetical protein [Spirochaetota bacterium]
MEVNDKRKLRAADFITAICLIVFSIIILKFASDMPIRDTYAGVESKFYVSPALFPILISGILIILAIVLLLKSIKDGGMKYLL